MSTVLHAIAVYLFLLLVFRLAGKRTLAQATPFDVVLLLIISEAVQNALVGDDRSLTNAFLIVLTLVGTDIALSLSKNRIAPLARLLEDLPLVILEHGKPLPERMARVRVDLDDVLEAARSLHGLKRLDQVEFAVLERNGSISIIPIQSEK